MSSRQAAASVALDSEIDLLTLPVIEAAAVATQDIAAAASSLQPSSNSQQGVSEQPVPEPDESTSIVATSEDPKPSVPSVGAPDIKMQDPPSPTEPSPAPSMPSDPSSDPSAKHARSPMEARSTTPAKHDDSSSEASSTPSVLVQEVEASSSEDSAASKGPAQEALHADVAAADLENTAVESPGSSASDLRDSMQLQTEPAVDPLAAASNETTQEEGEMTDGDSSEDSDPYEPPEEVPLLDVEQQPVNHPSPSQADTDGSPPFSPAPVTSKPESPRPISVVTPPPPPSGAEDLPLVSPAGGHEVSSSLS